MMNPIWTDRPGIQQTVNYFPTRAVPEEAVGALGEFFSTASPIAYAAKQMKGRYSMNGLGQTEVHFDNAGLLVIAGIAIAAGLLSYQAGKAMAPKRTSERTWGWIGVPMGMFFGPWGLGVMGAISNSKKR